VVCTARTSAAHVVIGGAEMQAQSIEEGGGGWCRVHAPERTCERNPRRYEGI